MRKGEEETGNEVNFCFCSKNDNNYSNRHRTHNSTVLFQLLLSQCDVDIPCDPISIRYLTSVVPRG